ncbi:MAG: DUF3021 domain-containing protein [Actinomycetaceae bacterium]|nr:DUF3021 domain-containing protein [Actinomycetaceae bacterium]
MTAIHKIAKSALIGALAGITIGSICELVFSAVLSPGTYTPGVPEFLAQHDSELIAVVYERIAYALLGVYGSVTSVVFDLVGDKPRGLARATLAHVVLISVGFSLCGLYLRWFDMGLPLLSALVSFLLIYAAVWTIQYLVARRQIARINAALEHH